MHEHHGTHIPVETKRQRCSHSQCRVRLFLLSCKVYTSNTPLEGHLQIDMHIYYIVTAICISALYYITTAICISAPHFIILELRYAYRHHTLYIATAICLSALHFIYCNCDMYIGTALYILQLRYVYLQRTLYIATAICIPALHFIILQVRYVYRHCTLYIATAIYMSAMQLR